MRWWSIITVLCFYALPAAAAQQAGQVIFVAGTVVAQRPLNVDLDKGDAVFASDLLKIGARSRAQLMMTDGAKIALRPETEFRIEQYHRKGDALEQPDGSVVLAAQDSAVTGLIKGGFRTITGAIGKENTEDYKLKTPAATMGIRGTHFSVIWCAGDCVPPTGASGSTQIADGLYVGVSSGAITVSNDTGGYVVRAGEFVYVQDRNAEPVRLPETPAALLDTAPTEPVDEEASETELEQTISAQPPQPQPPPKPKALRPPPELPPNDGSTPFEKETEAPINTSSGGNLTEGEPPFSNSVALSGGPLDSGVNSEFTSYAIAGGRTFSGNDLTSFFAPFPGQFDADPLYSRGTAAIRDDGFDPDTGLGYGRWSNGIGSVTLSNGSEINLDLSNQSLHWIYGPQLSDRPALPITGSANFNLIVGNTDPTDNLGHSGFLGDATLFANFTTATVQSQLSFAINGANWGASGNGSINNESFSGSYTDIFTAGQPGGNGSFRGFFNALNADGIPNGAGLSYGLTNAQGVTVNGVVAFGPPAP